MTNNIKALLELSKQLPEGLQSDWKGTNHFELTVPYKNGVWEDYFWLCFGTFWDKSVWEHKDYLDRIGLLMDIAEALKEAEKDIATLIAQQELKKRMDKALAKEMNTLIIEEDK